MYKLNVIVVVNGFKICICLENVTRWERTVQDGEDELDVNRQAEAKQRQDIDRELRRADALKAERAAARARQDRADESVTAVCALILFYLLHSTHNASRIR